MKYITYSGSRAFFTALLKVLERTRDARFKFNLSFNRSKQEPFEEARSLTCQTYGSELAPLLVIVQRGERNDVQEVERLATLSERDWIRLLGEKAAQQKETIQTFLIEAIVARARYFFSAQFDVFL